MKKQNPTEMGRKTTTNHSGVNGAPLMSRLCRRRAARITSVLGLMAAIALTFMPVGDVQAAKTEFERTKPHVNIATPVSAVEELTLHISPTSLWPPNHRYVPVEISVNAPVGSELLAVA